MTAWSQTSFEMVKGEFHTINVHDFAASLDWESPQVASRIQTRGTTGQQKTRWIDRINNLPEYMRTFYNNHGQRVQEVLDGGSNYLSEPDDDQINTFCPFDDGSVYMILNSVTKTIEYNFPDTIDFRDPNAKRQFAVAAINDDVVPYFEECWAFIPYMFMSMSYDFPQAFWIGNGQKWGTVFGMTWDFLQETGRDSVCYTYYILYAIKNDGFDYRIDKFTDPGAVASAVTEYKGIVNAILADMPTTSRYDKVRYFNNWLTTHNAYSSAYTTGSFSPIVWSPMSALRGTNGPEGPVCEGYARAMKILCDKSGIPCILAVGDAIDHVGGTPEAHMWNEVQMNDDNWYAVDVTWNDPTIGGVGINDKESGAENEKWLLLGKNDEVNTGLTFAQSHPNQLKSANGESAFWDYDDGSFIADNKFDPVTRINPISPNQDNAIYSILGVKLNKTIYELEPGLYIINGRKVIIK